VKRGNFIPIEIKQEDLAYSQPGNRAETNNIHEVDSFEFYIIL